MQNKAICIIPARGGSKRIPRKNIKNFCGRPIIAYSIEAALKSNLFDEVMVSTDDSEIAEIAKQYGATVPFMRSTKASDDFATTADVLLEVLEKYKTDYNKKFNIACCIYACAPLITQDAFTKAHNKLVTEELDSVFPIAEYSTPIKRALRLDETEKVAFIFKENKLTRSQDLDSAYFDVGQYYWFNVASLLATKSLTTDNTKCIILPAMQAQDIDNEDDWKLAELKYKFAN
jgi:N-acylneuraminate cytidylyltransferase